VRTPACNYSTGEIIAIVTGFILAIIPGFILLVVLCSETDPEMESSFSEADAGGAGA
jgi:hypothetical protein